MKKLSQILVVAALSLFSVSTAIGMDNEIKVEEKAEFGKYLADSRGMTLYWHVKDVPGKSMCKDLPCTEKWPPYYQKAIVAPSGIAVQDFGEIKRTDGKKQTTFRGYPLYYNVNDKEPGDINKQKGNNILGVIVNPDNFPSKP